MGPGRAAVCASPSPERGNWEAAGLARAGGGLPPLPGGPSSGPFLAVPPQVRRRPSSRAAVDQRSAPRLETPGARPRRNPGSKEPRHPPTASCQGPALASPSSVHEPGYGKRCFTAKHPGVPDAWSGPRPGAQPAPATSSLPGPRGGARPHDNADTPTPWRAESPPAPLHGRATAGLLPAQGRSGRGAIGPSPGRGRQPAGGLRSARG